MASQKKISFWYFALGHYQRIIITNIKVSALLTVVNTLKKFFLVDADEFKTLLHATCQQMQAKAQHIEQLKLRAIKKRSQLTTANEKQNLSQREYSSLLKEREAELSRQVQQ